MATTRKKFIKHDSINLMPLLPIDITRNGVSMKTNPKEGTITYNGTVTLAYQQVFTSKIPLTAGTYTLYANKTAGWSILVGKSTATADIIARLTVASTDTSVSFTLEEDTEIIMWIHHILNLTFDNLVIKPMLLRGNMTSNLPPFEPYYDHKTIYKTYTRTANLIKITNWYTTISGLTITQKPNDSNTVTITGTSSRGAQAIANKNFYTADMLGKTITFSQSKKFTAWNDPAATFWQIWRDGKVYKITPTSSQTVTFEEGHTWSINVWCGTAGEKNYTISFWANEGTVAKPFQPYSTVTYKKHIVEGT